MLVWDMNARVHRTTIEEDMQADVGSQTKLRTIITCIRMESSRFTYTLHPIEICNL